MYDENPDLYVTRHPDVHVTTGPQPRGNPRGAFSISSATPPVGDRPTIGTAGGSHGWAVRRTKARKGGVAQEHPEVEAATADCVAPAVARRADGGVPR